MHRTTLLPGLLLGLLCLGGCGVAHARQARDQELVDIAACQGTYPQARGTLAPLMRCEDAAVLAYANRIAHADVGRFDRYARSVDRSALAVDRGRMSMSAWHDVVGRERVSLAPPRDPRMQALVAALPAAPSAT